MDPARAGRLHILECQRLIRFMPKVVIAVVNGWAAGGGHSLHAVCDLTLASAEHARFKQTDADVGSFDGGFGSAYLARATGQKFAREIFFLGRTYDAEKMHRMGAVNDAVVAAHAELEATAIDWAKEINGKSPTAQRMLKYSFNLIDDGLIGQQTVRRRDHPPRIHDRRGRRRPRRLPPKTHPRLVPLPLVLLSTRTPWCRGSGHLPRHSVGGQSADVTIVGRSPPGPRLLAWDLASRFELIGSTTVGWEEPDAGGAL